MNLHVMRSAAVGAAAILSLSPLAWAQSLDGDVQAVNGFSGGTQVLTLDAGPDAAGERYLVLGSISGTSPGIPLPNFTIPLNADAYFQRTLSNPNSAILANSSGVLDANGQATITFNFPALGNAELSELTFNHAALITDGASFQTVSNPEPVLVSVGGALVVERPLEGATVGTATVDVEGRLPASLTGREGLTVTVGAVAAELVASESGFDRFIARGVRLAIGANTIEVIAEAPGVVSQSTTVDVTHDLLRANNIVISAGVAYAALGGEGIGVVKLDTRQATTIPAPTGSVDDLSVADGFLFTLDGAGAGALAVFDLSEPANPALVDGPVTVPVGPFAGVSAAAGRVVTSGGTSLLRVYEYDAGGRLSTDFAQIDLGFGQPDVLLGADGQSAFVSTDFAGNFDGATFGITLLGLNSPPALPTIEDRIGLIGSGFTSGTQDPANFPIESALLGDFVVTAHGGGLSVLQAGIGNALTTLSLPFEGINVDAVGEERAYVVGAAPARSLAVVDLSVPTSPVLVSSRTFAGPGTFTAVATDGEVVAIAANEGGIIIVDAE